MKRIEHNINFDHLTNIAKLGVRRAAVFMGLGLNAAYRQDFKDYELTKLPKDPENMSIGLIPDGANERTVEQYKRQFADWVISCGLGEVLEHYGLFLTQIHHHALVVFQSKQLLQYLGDPRQLQRNFHENPGIASKLDTLDSRFRIATEHSTSIKRLYQLRNAMSHNFRYVGDKQVRGSTGFDVKWLALDVCGIGMESGIERPFSLLRGMVLPEETQMIVRTTTRERTYRKGERVDLTRRDLEEICMFFVTWCIPSMANSFLEFLKKHGVPIAEKAADSIAS